MKKAITGVVRSAEVLQVVEYKQIRDAGAGGMTLYIPPKPEEHHAISKLMGLEIAKKLSTHFGSKAVIFPKINQAALKERNNHLFKDRHAGLSFEDLSAKYHLSALTIRYMVTIHHRKLRSLGQSYPHYEDTKRKERNRKIVQDRHNGDSHRELSRKYRLSVSAIAHILRQERRGN